MYTIKGEEVACDWQANGFRLPSEVEWEYACRAGTPGERYNKKLEKIAWYYKNSGKTTQAVGRKLPNKWGLYDMLGNVWEWCWDRYGDYPVEPQSDWHGPDSGSDRVIRGGSCSDSAINCRASFRFDFHPARQWNLCGFRLARSL